MITINNLRTKEFTEDALNTHNNIEECYGSWTACANCVYFEDCTNKEDRDGCYHGEEEVV